MAIDVLDYAVLGNHLHLVLRNRPDLVGTWSDDEVARRWWLVCPLRRNPDGSIPDPRPCELGLLRQKVDEYRARLSDISCFMRLACQPIARRANQEDEVDGRFFAKRFDCRRLKTRADVLSCNIYVDLNVIRAGLAETPETSEFWCINGAQGLMRAHPRRPLISRPRVSSVLSRAAAADLSTLPTPLTQGISQTAHCPSARSVTPSMGMRCSFIHRFDLHGNSIHEPYGQLRRRL